MKLNSKNTFIYWIFVSVNCHYIAYKRFPLQINKIYHEMIVLFVPLYHLHCSPLLCVYGVLDGVLDGGFELVIQ